jgi:methionyl-tRNA synthetase
MVGEQVAQSSGVVINPVPNLKISFSDWSKVDLRVGLIELVEDVVGKDKLFKLTVDFASEKRIILAGLKPFYSKEELQGKKTVFVFNLAPRPLAGIESNGMILAVKTSDGKYKITLIDDSVPQGAKLE